MKYTIVVLYCFLALFLFLERNNIGSKFEKEFNSYIRDCDKILFDGDELHPTYAFLKNGKVIGIEINNHPECGDYTKRYFLSQNEQIDKVVIEIDYFNEHCGKTFDSVFVIDSHKNKVKVYTESTKGKEIISDILQRQKIDINDFKQNMKNWQSK